MDTLLSFVVCLMFFITNGSSQDNTPSFIAEMEIKSGTEGQSVTLTCRYKYKRPGTSIQWVKADMPLVINQGEIILPMAKRRGPTKYLITERGEGEVVTSELWISDMHITDEGQYRCILKSNDIPTYAWPKKNGALHLLVPAKVTKVDINVDKIQTNGDRIYVREGGNITLYCVASGRPDPNVQWMLGNDVMLVNSSEGKSEVELKSVTRNMSGNYICIADNDLGDPSSRSVFVGIFGPTECQGPILTDNSCFKYQYDGITIEFIVSAFPVPNITWFRRLQNGTEIELLHEDNTGVDIWHSDTELPPSLWNSHVFHFHISHFTTKDTGEYRYYAVNGLGSCTIRFNISISDICDDSNQRLEAQSKNAGTVISSVWGVSIIFTYSIATLLS